MFSNRVIKSSVIETIIISFLFGVIATIIVYNISAGEILEFSTLGLLGFTLSIIFGGASLVLSLVAINLSKISEHEITRRNNESINAQNKTLEKTIDTLSSIKVSTGVMEKRQEDIMSLSMSHLYDKMKKGEIQNREEFNSEIEKSIGRTYSKEEENILKERDKAIKKYDEYYKHVLTEIQSDNIVKKTIKDISHGSNYRDSTAIFDSVFLINNSKAAFSVFSEIESIEDIFIDGFESFIGKTAQALNSGLIDYFFYIGATKSKTYKALIKELEKYEDIILKRHLEKMYIITGEDKEIIQKINELIG